ncbi:MAG: hypothetical protein CMO55_25360 [Verrucomicrobiales bacterium]|nr:hypothetical protein [Verrucomicrobiales bacterium]
MTRRISLVPIYLAIFLAPIAFGGTTPGSRSAIDILLGVSFIGWVIHRILERKGIRMVYPKVCRIALLVLVALTVCYLVNAKYVHRSDTWAFAALPSAISWLPGTVDRATSMPVALHLGALLGAFLVLGDYCRSREVRWNLLAAVAIAGGMIALIGIAQKASGADSMLWVGPDRSGEVFFAAFRYHANAASFLNLSWPIALALVIRSRERGETGVRLSIWFAVFLVTLVAVFVNTSKAGHILGLLGIFVLGFRFRRSVWRSGGSPIAITVGVILVVGLAVFAILPSAMTIFGKWDETITTGGSLKGRWLAYGACLHAIVDNGILGTGPGTFHLVFPYYTTELGDRISGVWVFAHQDYLQALIEWGYLGTACWAVLIGGGVWLGTKSIIRVRRKTGKQISSNCLLVALGLVLLHALVDFPFHIPAIQFLVMIFLAMLWADGARSHRGYSTNNKKARRKGELSQEGKQGMVESSEEGISSFS